jgi:leucyl aminopeptidase
MELEVRRGDVIDESVEVAVLLCVAGTELPEPLAGLPEAADFTAKPNATVVVYPRGVAAPTRLVLVGLGDEPDTERVRQAAATGVRAAQGYQAAGIAVGVLGAVPVDPTALGEALAIGLELGAYRYLEHKTGLSDQELFEVATVVVLAADDADIEALTEGVTTGGIIAGGVNLARDLVNTPGAMKTPPQLADEAVALGARTPGVTVTVLDETELAEAGFGGVLAVGGGSDSPPRFIIMEYGAELTDAPTVCVVGKGLTFDSGGLNIKPFEGMLNMKNDMGGSAAVFGAVHAAALLELPVHVVGLVPSAENMPSGRSYRPGDIVTTLSGKTIEVLNTDAEGRVILSDGLHYAQRYEPDAIVELSTLTGAIITALANHATGVMATDQDLADRIIAAGEASGDRGWQLPLWDEYHEMIKGDVGDLKNLGGPAGGSITAGAFLAAFAGDYPFVHLDIAGTAWLDKPTKPYQYRGGTGAGVRMVVQYLRALADR